MLVAVQIRQHEGPTWTQDPKGFAQHGQRFSGMMQHHVENDATGFAVGNGQMAHLPESQINRPLPIWIQSPPRF